MWCPGAGCWAPLRFLPVDGASSRSLSLGRKRLTVVIHHLGIIWLTPITPPDSKLQEAVWCRLAVGALQPCSLASLCSSLLCFPIVLGLDYFSLFHCFSPQGPIHGTRQPCLSHQPPFLGKPRILRKPRSRADSLGLVLQGAVVRRMEASWGLGRDRRPLP